MRLLTFAAALIALTGCSGASDVSGPPVRPTVTLSATSAWSGDTIALTSASFTGIDTLPWVTLGAETLAVRRHADSVLAILPDTNGVVTLKVTLHDGADTTADVHVYGFVNVSAGPALTWFSNPWSSQGPTVLLGGTGHKLWSYDIASGATAALTDTVAYWSVYQSITPSLTEPGLVPVPLSSGGWVALPVAAGAGSPDTNNGGNNGLWVHLSRRHWLWVNSGAGNATQTVTRADSGWVYGAWVDGCLKPYGAVVSPRHDRVAFRFCQGWGTGATPVYDSAGALAYRVAAGPGGENGTAVFSSTGDTLFMTTMGLGRGDPTGRLLVLDATTGAVLDSVITPGPAQGGIGLDPAKPLLYLTDGQDIYVYNRTTLTQEAVLRGAPKGIHEIAPNAYVDPTSRRLIVVNDCYPGDANIRVFQLMP